jgi:hypothetical protein
MEGFLFSFFIFAIYFLPFLIALIRNHIDSTAIFVLNLFLGWTFFGWVIALVWAVKKFDSNSKNSAKN